MSRMASIRACALWLLPLLACAQVTVSRASLLVRLLPLCSARAAWRLATPLYGRRHVRPTHRVGVMACPGRLQADDSEAGE